MVESNWLTEPGGPVVSKTFMMQILKSIEFQFALRNFDLQAPCIFALSRAIIFRRQRTRRPNAPTRPAMPTSSLTLQIGMFKMMVVLL